MGKKGIYYVFAAATIMLIVKMAVSFHTYGTNDMAQWKYFAEFIEQYGSFKIYNVSSLATFYNHTPLVSWLLKSVYFIFVKTGISFQFVFRMLPILADYASIFVIWSLLGIYGVKRRVLICILCSINPVNLAISGFHGNLDPVFILLVLLAVYYTEKGHNLRAGLAYGISLCIKVVPVIFLPFFIYYIRKEEDRVKFVSVTFAVLAAVFLPYLINDFHAVTNNICLYSSLKGNWGIGQLLSSVFINENMNIHARQAAYYLFKAHNASAVVLYFIMAIAFSKYLNSGRRVNLTEGIFTGCCLFMLITAGFGVQYLSWISYFAIMISPVLGSLYVLAGGLFLYRVYAFWGALTSPYYADSYTVGQWYCFGNNINVVRGDQWIGIDKGISIILWLIIAAMLMKFIIEKGYFSRSAKVEHQG